MYFGLGGCILFRFFTLRIAATALLHAPALALASYSAQCIERHQHLGGNRTAPTLDIMLGSRDRRQAHRPHR